MLYPYKLMPVYKDYLWGGRNLSKLGKGIPEGRVAESWELSAMPGSESRIANGPLKGQSLARVIHKYGMLMLGEKVCAHQHHSGLPILLKYIDANDKLSVQVHPDDDYARRYEQGKLGKTELWYILDAKPDATIIHGFTEGYGRERIHEAILKQRHQGLYRGMKVKKGDVVYVPAGTVHGLNDGLVVAEIQQHSDLTYRLYDYDRTDGNGKKRQLHVQQALDVLDMRNRKAVYPGLAVWDRRLRTKVLAINEYFCVKLIEGRGNPVELNSDGTFTAYMFLTGEAEITAEEERVRVSAMETVFIPAYMGSYEISGLFTALQIFVPDSVAAVYTDLLKKGFSYEEIFNSIAGVENLYIPLKTAI